MAALKRGPVGRFFAAVFGYAEILSLDICIGVVGSGALAASLLHADMRLAWWFLLPAAVWVIYTADHLLDARKVRDDFANARHEFHRRHFRVLATLAILTALACFVAAIFFLSDIVVKGGLLLCLMAAFHLGMAFWGKIRFGKEISVAVIYSLGVWFAPYLRRGCSVTGIHMLAFGFFVLAALLNLLMNSIMEYEMDEKEKLRFATGVLSLNRMRIIVVVVSWLASLAILVILKYGIKLHVELTVISGFVFLFILCAVPGIIISEEKFYKKNKRYRVQAEWVFSLGMLLLFLPK
ncbi:MAG: prenyltransferase [Spirochaetes bacterium]|nr:prenyltransferase [Spirochaetota bacterium]